MATAVVERGGYGRRVERFQAADGTWLAFHRAGDGEPVVCLPGGPMRASAYLGDLGGLPDRRAVARLDLRGTGESAEPADPASYRCDRQVADVEALRTHLGLDSIDVLAHSAGATLALLYAAEHPDRVRRLVLVTPSPRAVGMTVSALECRRVAEQRRGEPWFPDAYAAFERIWAGTATADDWTAITPFTYGRWDTAAQTHAARAATETNSLAAAAYYAPTAFDPAVVRTSLQRLDAPVLLVATRHDVLLPLTTATEYTTAFPRRHLSIPTGGHYPWLDDPAAFVRDIATFLT